jgi:hypothetical protein
VRRSFDRRQSVNGNESVWPTANSPETPNVVCCAGANSISIVSAAVQPLSADVPMTVYVVVAVGKAVTVVPVVVLRPVGGLHV